MCGGTSTSAPAPDPAQTQLEQEQLKILQQQQDDIHGFQPFVLQQYGMQSAATGSKAAEAKQLQDQIAFNDNVLHSSIANGGVGDNAEGIADYKKRNENLQAQLDKLNSSYEYTPDQLAKNAQLKALQDQQLAVQTANNQRIQDALAGKIGPSDALTRQKNLDFQTLMNDENNKGNEIMGDSLDNATAKTTSGQQALSALKTTYGALQSQEINNIINSAPAVSGAYQAQYNGGNPNAASTAMASTLSPLASLTPQFASAYAPYLQDQQLKANANNVNATNSTNMLTGLISAGMSAAGTGAGLAVASSRTFKKDITAMTSADEEALVKHLTETPTYRWRYTSEDSNVPRHVGFITEEAPPELVTEDGKHLSVVDYLGMITVALKVMSRKLDQIETKVGH